MRNVVDGKAVVHGRPLLEWVPEVVADLVAGFDPLSILLVGSLARGDDGPDSDIDLVVVMPRVAPELRHELMSAMQLAVRVPVAVDIFPTDPDEFSQRKDVVGSFLYWPSRDGRVVYERAA
ncbi:MAG: nucleotidyltransferase domain-containing protein [Actinobacteria bacterium]|jgi:predicted nucleotidyltransferase|nr:nucleotidyltransferase domain-containing protein [Actinomycetota bacterium]MDA8184756.1 nucleotidyltransferase domain-containing protein [Actinomycetota bacterium]